MEEEFRKYIGDYLKDHPEEELHYWSEYPPHGDKGNHYAIFTHVIEKECCSCCGHEEIVEVRCTGEHGLTFEVTTEK